MEKIIYERPEIIELTLSSAKGGGGESCYIDCASDDICPTPDDEI